MELNQPSLKRAIRSIQAEYKAQKNLLIQIQSFDIDFCNPKKPISKRFAKENTDEKCQPLSTEASLTIFKELKNFFFLCVLRIRNMESQKQIKKQCTFVAPFVCPPTLIDAWDTFILYSLNYNTFCNIFFGGYLDKSEFINLDNEYESYCDLLQLYSSKEKIMHSEQQYWPKYQQKEYSLKREQVKKWTTCRQRNIFINFINEELRKSPILKNNAEISSQILKAYKESLQNDLIHTSEESITSITVAISAHSYIKQGLDDIETLVYKLNQFQMPNHIEIQLRSKFCFSSPFSQLCWIEYKKYLLLAIIGKRSVSPSQFVDQIWHLHQTMTQQYRQDCISLFEKVIQHRPISEDKKEIINDMILTVNYTKELYNAVFKNKMPEDVWKNKKCNLHCTFVDLPQVIDFYVAEASTINQKEIDDTVIVCKKCCKKSFCLKQELPDCDPEPGPCSPCDCPPGINCCKPPGSDCDDAKIAPFESLMNQTID